MTTARTVMAKVGDWKAAFDAIRVELTPDTMRTILSDMAEVEGVPQLQSYMQLANGVMANDRTAAQVAATLVYSGVKAPVDYGETD